jgi:hypothetical protein
MLQNVRADDVIELAAEGRQAIIKISAGEFHSGGMRAVRPIDAGDGESPLGQNLRQVSDGTTDIQDAATFSVFGKLSQQQSMTAIRRRFELISGSSLGCRGHCHHYDTPFGKQLRRR